MRRAGVLAIVAMFTPLLAAPVAQSERILGLSLEIVPPVVLRTSPRGPDEPLDAKRHAGRTLFEGQALQAGQGGRVKFTYLQRTEELTAQRGRFE